MDILEDYYTAFHSWEQLVNEQMKIFMRILRTIKEGVNVHGLGV